MKKPINVLPFLYFIFLITTISCNHHKQIEKEDEEHEKYDGIKEMMQREFDMTKDPALGRVPIERLWDAISYTEALKQSNNYRSLSVVWQERGPIYDSVGPSNTNGRGGGTGITGGYSSGRINGFLVDIGDPSGNTVFTGGACGGIWRCTNFLSTTAAPNWVAVNDAMSNMSIVSFAQDPTNSNTMYVATGEPWYNNVAVRGNGIYKSIDHGVTWTQLVSTTGIGRSFKIICDASGNVFYATGDNGLLRSKNGGANWMNITPTSIPNNTTSNCTDIELSSTGKLHASFGYGGYSGITTIFHQFTSTPATATSSSSWITSTGINSYYNRLELATIADTIYAITGYDCYKSTDGGLTFSITSGLYINHPWWSITLSINPTNSHEIIVGGLDAYKSSDDGQTFLRLTHWVTNAPYVHADHHLMQWTKLGETQNIISIATDGGIFYSLNNGVTFIDRNKNLAIKQFYSCAIHPSDANYVLGGAQDNGSHQFKNAGLSYSTEVTGGDGAFVDIDQDQPQYQFTSYVYNQYRRSTNGGATWDNFDIGGFGSFINPFDYDDVQNIMLCGADDNSFLRWNDPQTASSSATASTNTISLTELNGIVSTIQVSPYTTGRAYFGSSSGRIVRVDNTLTTTGSGTSDVTLLNQPASGNVSCIAVGTNDNNLLAVYSNYGINNVWYSNNGGTTWTGIDGNLPDMPVRWAVFHPTDNNKILIATEAGVFTSGLVNAGSTQWFPSPGFPLVRTDMLKLRKSDNTVVAATHGRGMWSGNILEILPLRNITLTGTLENDNRVNLSWKIGGSGSQVKYFVQTSNDGINYQQIAELTSTFSYKHFLNTNGAYYRILATEPNAAPVFSNVVFIKSNKNIKGLQVKVSPNPLNSIGNLSISSSITGNYNWQLCNVQGSVLKTGNGNIQAGTTSVQPIEVSKLSPGMYIVKVLQGNEKQTTTFIKQ